MPLRLIRRTKILPPSLTHLTLTATSDYFERADIFDILSPTLVSLCMQSGDEIQHPTFPPSIQRLEFSYTFIHADVLPSLVNLTYLSLGTFSRPLPVLPRSLLSLEFGGQVDGPYVHPLDNLPPSLTSLHLNCIVATPIDYLPASITSLTIKESTQSLDHLPPRLLYLKIGSALPTLVPPFRRNEQILHLDHLPSSLISLKIIRRCTTPLTTFPHLCAAYF